MHRLAIASTRVLNPSLAVFASFLAFSLAIYAQNTTGRVIGTVSDAKGAVIADATVTVTNTSTNKQWQAVTGSEGAYQVLELPIGSYSVAVEHKGFKKLITTPQPLDINQSLRIDVRLEVGALQEVVTVRSEAAQVETVNLGLGANPARHNSFGRGFPT